jgi:hypothetical protein
MNLYDIAWIKATLEMGRTNPEYPAYKVLKLLCDELDAVATEDTNPVAIDIMNMVRK